MHVIGRKLNDAMPARTSVSLIVEGTFEPSLTAMQALNELRCANL